MEPRWGDPDRLRDVQIHEVTPDDLEIRPDARQGPLTVECFDLREVRLRSLAECLTHLLRPLCALHPHDLVVGWHLDDALRLAAADCVLVSLVVLHELLRSRLLAHLGCLILRHLSTSLDKNRQTKGRFFAEIAVLFLTLYASRCHGSRSILADGRLT